jgi:hypothetical protein
LCSEENLILDRDAIGRPQPWVVTHRGLEYPGEVVLAGATDPALGQRLTGGLCFRVVIHTEPRRLSSVPFDDPRIAMCVPRRSTQPGREGAGREIQAIRETRERYMAGEDSLRRSMSERESSLMAEIARHEAQNYSQGRIYVHDQVLMRPSWAFDGENIGSWVDSIVAHLLEAEYPSLPFDHTLLPGTLTHETAEAVFRGIVQGDPAAAEVASAYGPPLGLSSPARPGAFDPSDGKIPDAIVTILASGSGEMPAGALLDLLCRDYGINYTLATLYLLAFVRSGGSGVRLAQGHDVRTRHGEPFVSDWIMQDILDDIRFSDSISGDMELVSARPDLTWNMALPYASLLVDGLEGAEEESEVNVQESRLVAGLEETRAGLDEDRERFEGLLLEIDRAGEPSLAELLDGLRSLCSATDFRSFYAIAVDRFGGPAALAQAVELYARVERLALIAPEISATRAYLSEMTFGREHHDLSVQRDLVVGRIGLDSLLADPSVWPSVLEGYRILRRGHADAYVLHHRRYHVESSRLAIELDRVNDHLAALEKFNAVPEFGSPCGQDLPEMYHAAAVALRACPHAEDSVPLDQAPYCDHCMLPLGEMPQQQSVAAVVGGTEAAMREYNRRLSSNLVHQVLANPSKEHLDKLMDLIQLGNLSSLSNVLDEEVLKFLRSLVSQP